MLPYILYNNKFVQVACKIQEATLHCRSRFFSLPVNLPKREYQRNRKKSTPPCASFYFKTIKTLETETNTLDKDNRPMQNSIAIEPIRQTVSIDRLVDTTFVCKISPIQVWRIVRRDKECYTLVALEEDSKGCKSLARREIKKNGEWVALSIRRITRGRERVKEDGASPRWEFMGCSPRIANTI